jgi:phosphohistidine phosphatase
MRRLMLIRHAKSSWKNEAVSDHARPLNKRGRRAAPAVAEHLASIGWVPDLAYCSDALRAVESWDLMAKPFHQPPMETHPSLYHAGWDEFSSVVSHTPADIKTLAVVGHNPGWEEVLEHLSGEALELKTADVALLESDEDQWPGTAWRLLQIIRAREV